MKVHTSHTCKHDNNNVVLDNYEHIDIQDRIITIRFSVLETCVLVTILLSIMFLCFQIGRLVSGCDFIYNMRHNDIYRQKELSSKLDKIFIKNQNKFL